MTSEQQSRFEVLVEDMQSQMRALAEATVANTQSNNELRATVSAMDGRLDRLAIKVDVVATTVDKIETKVDKLETKVDKLETKVDKLETKVDELASFATDAKQRFERIESHLQANGAPKRSRKPAARKKR